MIFLHLFYIFFFGFFLSWFSVIFFFSSLPSFSLSLIVCGCLMFSVSGAGHAGAEPLENGEVRGEAGNGSSSSTVSLPAAGVACFPDSVEKPEGSALQSLRLSIPMQETELCKHTTVSHCPVTPPPPPPAPPTPPHTPRVTAQAALNS